jgi:hypothetical protein
VSNFGIEEMLLTHACCERTKPCRILDYKNRSVDMGYTATMRRFATSVVVWPAYQLDEESWRSVWMGIA